MSCVTHSSITFDFLSTMCQCLKGYFPCSPHSSRAPVPALHSQGIWPSLSGCCLQLCRFIPISSYEHFYFWLAMWRPTLDLSKVRRCNTRSVLLYGGVVCMGLILWIMDCYFICSAYFHGCWINYFVSADYNFATMLQFKLPVQ